MEWLASKLRQQGLNLSYGVLDIGALPIEGESEPLRQLLSAFPSSRLSSVEIDPRVCEDLNRNAPAGNRYYPVALGRTEEKRRLYETVHPMCTSLYPPDERYADLYNNLEETRLIGTSEITTISLDRFVRDNGLGAIDAIKIDIQGAELEVFQGGTDVLRDVLFVICEVEFVPMYHGQPLFGDVAACLRKHDLAFHKFLGMAGRVMKPLTAHGHPNYPVQFLWSDALFVRNLFRLDALSADQLLKSAVLFDLYDSKDAALYVLQHYDVRQGTGLGAAYLDHLNAAGAWKSLPLQNQTSS